MEKIKVLYVDDEDINLKLMSIILKNKYDIITIDNGASGLEILLNEPQIKVVISDMKMPIMNGLEFIKKAKNQHPDIKYFILSGYDKTSEIAHAIEQGLIVDYFQKPFNMNDIDREIMRQFS